MKFFTTDLFFFAMPLPRSALCVMLWKNGKCEVWALVSFGGLFLAFAKVGVMTFGGGYAMLPMLQREIVENHGWATDEELADYFAVGQCTPGVIAVNTATFVGYKQKGVLGGLAATLGVVFPSLVIIMVLAGAISLVREQPIVQKAFAGIRVCVCVLILNSVIKLWKSAVKGRLALCIYLAVAVCATLFSLSPVLFVLLSAALGVALELVRGRGVK